MPIRPRLVPHHGNNLGIAVVMSSRQDDALQEPPPKETAAPACAGAAAMTFCAGLLAQEQFGATVLVVADAVGSRNARTTFAEGGRLDRVLSDALAAQVGGNRFRTTLRQTLVVSIAARTVGMALDDDVGHAGRPEVSDGAIKHLRRNRADFRAVEGKEHDIGLGQTRRRRRRSGSSR